MALTLWRVLKPNLILKQKKKKRQKQKKRKRAARRA